MIIFSQVRFLLGIQAQSFVGPFKLPKHYVEIGKNIHHTNIADLVISLICITVLFTVKVCNTIMKGPLSNNGLQGPLFVKISIPDWNRNTSNLSAF